MDKNHSFFEAYKKQLESFRHLAEILDIRNYTFDDEEEFFAKLGWYIPRFVMAKMVYNVSKLIDDGDIVEAENILIKYFKKNIKEIEATLIESHPERSQILHEAFLCFKKKYYYASTILFLSQADGICDAIIFRAKKIKSTKNNKHRVINLLSKKNSLTDYFSIETKNHNYLSDLNRHGVMHGISLDYGNVKNNLKALSLVCFVTDFNRSK